MTTIAYDYKTGEIASDSQETGGGGEKFHCRKLFRVNGHIVATAGGSYSGQAFVNWLKSWKGKPPDWEDHPDFTNLDMDEDFECLVLPKKGKAYTVNRLFVPKEVAGNRFITLGSGGPAAMGALLAGASVKEAINIARLIDTYTGGRVQYMRVKK